MLHLIPAIMAAATFWGMPQPVIVDRHPVRAAYSAGPLAHCARVTYKRKDLPGLVVGQAEVGGCRAWFDFNQAATQCYLRRVVKHETGHLLGLGHSNTGIMRPVLPRC